MLCLLLPVVMAASPAHAQTKKSTPAKKEPAKPGPAQPAPAPGKPAPKAKPTWQVVDYRGLPYLDFNDVSAFFEFDKVTRDGGAIRLQKLNADGRVLVDWRATAGTKLVSLNLIKFYLSYPVVKWKDGRLLLSAFDLLHVIDPILRPDQQREPMALKVIVLDPARGGDETGVTTRHGKEKDVTLDIALRLKPQLEKAGYKVVLTRTGDVTMPVPERVALANSVKDEGVFVSLHCSYGSDREKGLEMFTLAPSGTPATTGEEGKPVDQKFYPGNINDRESMALATALQGVLVGQLKAADLGIRRARFNELKGVEMPAVVLSVGRLGHPEEGKKLGAADGAYRQQVATALATGLERFAAVMAVGAATTNRDLKFGTVTSVREPVDPSVGEVVRVRAAIVKTRPEAIIDPKKVTLQIYFLDHVNDDELDLSSCNTPRVRWLSVTPNWKDAHYEEVEFTYEQPAFDSALLKQLGRRTYYGYVLRLVYNDELMDEHADPANVRRGLGNFTAVMPRRK